MVQEFPHVSVSLRQPAALDWLDHATESNSIMSAILAVIHPELYDAGRNTFKELRKHSEIEPQEILHRWTSVYSGISVICNRLTPAHRDVSARKQWYDMLVSVGRYRNCNLKLPGLGVSLEYGPGSVVGVLAAMLEHQVSHFEGERVCYVYFMRDVVHEWAGVTGRSWMSIDRYPVA